MRRQTWPSEISKTCAFQSRGCRENQFTMTNGGAPADVGPGPQRLDDSSGEYRTACFRVTPSILVFVSFNLSCNVRLQHRIWRGIAPIVLLSPPVGSTRGIVRE